MGDIKQVAAKKIQNLHVSHSPGELLVTVRPPDLFGDVTNVTIFCDSFCTKSGCARLIFGCQLEKDL